MNLIAPGYQILRNSSLVIGEDPMEISIADRICGRHFMSHWSMSEF
jgi:hypothetical protein